METPVNRLRSVAAALRLDMITPQGVITEAVELLSDLPLNRPLAELAGAEPLRGAVAEVLSRALVAEGSDMPSDNEAGRIVAETISKAIVTGAVAPSEGARAIWWKVVRRIPELESELGHFIGLASEWEDDTAHRAEYENDIRQAAAKLADRPDSSASHGLH